MFATLALPQPHEPERQQAAQLGAALGGRHVVGRQRVGAFHDGRLRDVSALSYSR